MLFLDKSGKYYYLVFAFFANREKVYLGKTDQISIDKLNQLVQKQYDFFVNQKLFKDFDDQIQHPHLLHNILKKNLMISILLYTKYLPENVILDQDILKLYNKYTSYYDQDFVLDFVYNSNKIEGSQIPQDQIKKIIQNRLFTYYNKNELKEVLNSQKALNFMQDGFIFNQKSIKKLYHIFTDGLIQENGNKYPKGYKKLPNIIGNMATTIPKQVQDDMQKLLDMYKKEKKKKFPIHLAFDFHFLFERIHPFQNGNGRVGRFLMNKILQINGFCPMVIWEQNREKYFNSFVSATNKDKKKYYKFLLEQYRKSLNILD